MWSNIPFGWSFPRICPQLGDARYAKSWAKRWSSQEIVLDIAAASAVPHDAGVAGDRRCAAPEQTLVATTGQPNCCSPMIISGIPVRQGAYHGFGRRYLLTAEVLPPHCTRHLHYALLEQGRHRVGPKVSKALRTTTLNCMYGRLRALDISDEGRHYSNVYPMRSKTHARMSAQMTPVNFGSSSAGDGKLYDYTARAALIPILLLLVSVALVLSGENITTVNLWRNKLTTLDVSGCPNAFQTARLPDARTPNLRR